MQEKGQFVRHEEEYPVNLTTIGIQTQNAVFGNVKQGRVAVRFQQANDVRTGYFIVDGQNYQIENSLTTDKHTTLYGVEYHGRF